MLQHFIGVWFSQFSYCRLNPSRSPNSKSTRPPANHSLFRYCWQTSWLWDSRIAIHHIQEETATEDRIFIMNLAIVYKLYLGIKNIRFEENLSYSSIVPRRENNIKGIHWLWTSKWNSCYSWFPNSLQYSLRGWIWSDLISNWSILILPHFIEGAPQNVRIGDGYALHSDSIKVTTQLKASENT